MATTAGTNLTHFDQALKIDYLPVIREQLNHSTILMDKIQRNERDVSGQKWQMTAHYQRNSGVGAGAETGLPTAGRQLYANPYGTVKYNRARITVSGPVMAASRDDKGAIIKALESEIKGATRDLKKEINYQLFNDGSAVRALINGEPGEEVTLTLDSPGTRYLWDGMLVSIVDPSTYAPTTSGTGLTLSTVTSDTSAELSANTHSDVANNDAVIRSGARLATSPYTSYEMMGIKGIVDDATYVTTLHGLSRSTYPWWKCSTHSNDDNSGTNRDLAFSYLQDSVSAVEKNGGQVKLIVSDMDARDAYASLLVADKRFVNTMELDGGWKALEFNGIPWVADMDCPPNTIYFLDLDHLFLMQMGDFDWMDKDGAVLSRVADSDAYEAVLYWYADLATDRPRAHSFLRDISN